MQPDFFLFIRPSGIPIGAKGFHDMLSSGDLELQSTKSTKVHKFEILVQILQYAFSI